MLCSLSDALLGLKQMTLVTLLTSALEPQNSVISRDIFLYIQTHVSSLDDFTYLFILLFVLLGKLCVIITRMAMEVSHIADNEAITKFI